MSTEVHTPLRDRTMAQTTAFKTYAIGTVLFTGFLFVSLVAVLNHVKVLEIDVKDLFDILDEHQLIELVKKH